MLAADVGGQLSAALGVRQETAVNGQKVPTARRTTFLIDTNFRIRKIYTQVDPSTHPAEVLADVKSILFAEEPRPLRMHAPVLIIPDVLDQAKCHELMQLWETEGHGDSGYMKQVGDQTVGILDHRRKIRQDHFMKPGPRVDELKGLFARRVVPEIKKAFDFAATRVEDIRIACYDASSGGFFRPHRDNGLAGVAHRRFAMSLNLNTGEYEGGYIRFPEYGGYLYRPEAGAAVIFSCSLLHEATDVTAGRRFVLLTFFYGDREAKIREEYSRRTGGTYKA
jgi:predicted 2-oxoglutarate/Fe(II)-dependent dioxygenase YbiX